MAAYFPIPASERMLLSAGGVYWKGYNPAEPIVTFPRDRLEYLAEAHLRGRGLGMLESTRVGRVYEAAPYLGLAAFPTPADRVIPIPERGEF